MTLNKILKKIAYSNRLTTLMVKGVRSLRRDGLKITWQKMRSIKKFGKVNVRQYSAHQLAEQRRHVFPRNILFSILVPLYNTPSVFLHDMIRSVQNQTYAGWELCLADGSDEAHAEVGQICREYAQQDSRIRYQKLEKNLGISGNTNACLAMAQGDYISLLDHDDVLHTAALYEVANAICTQDADFIFTDEATFCKDPFKDAYNHHFKPDYAPDTLRGCNYICHFTTAQKALFDQVGGFRSEYDGSQDYDMILRLTEKAKTIVHIPKCLYFWRAHAQSVAQDISTKDYALAAAMRALHAHFQRIGLPCTVEKTRYPSFYRVRYDLPKQPLVSILIPNWEQLSTLQACLESIWEKTTYPNYEIIIIENNSTSEEIFRYYQEIQQSHANVQVITWPGKGFNYPLINNYGASFAKGAHLILLNNDTEIISPDWIQEMLMYSQRSDVGAVGAKLYYPDDTIQHGGVLLGLGGVAGHSFQGFPRQHPGYMRRLVIAQNMSAVTAACMMIRRDVWDQVQGLNKAFAVAFNDVDLCMRIRQQGYLIVWTPFAELYHHESKSRNADIIDASSERFQKEARLFQKLWAKELAAGDPYYNPNLTLRKSNFSPR